jgi:hypothetical protein
VICILHVAAGEAYFAKVLNQSKGKDLLAAAKSAAPSMAAGSSGTAATGITRPSWQTFSPTKP